MLYDEPDDPDDPDEMRVESECLEYLDIPIFAEQEFLLEQTRVLLEQVRPGAVGADPAAVVTAVNST